MLIMKDKVVELSNLDLKAFAIGASWRRRNKGFAEGSTSVGDGSAVDLLKFIAQCSVV